MRAGIKCSSIMEHNGVKIWAKYMVTLHKHHSSNKLQHAVYFKLVIDATRTKAT